MTGKPAATHPPPLLRGTNVYVRYPVAQDAGRFCELMNASKRFHRSWVQPPLNGAEFAAYLKRARLPECVGLLVCSAEDHDIAGVFNLTQIVRGSLLSANLGYYAAAEHAGRGYMCEAMQLVLRFAFRMLKLHRIEVNIQPENVRSRNFAQRTGFGLEGFSPRSIKIAGRWRDHERWALLAENWNSQQK